MVLFLLIYGADDTTLAILYTSPSFKLGNFVCFAVGSFEPLQDSAIRKPESREDRTDENSANLPSPGVVPLLSADILVYSIQRITIDRGRKSRVGIAIVILVQVSRCKYR